MTTKIDQNPAVSATQQYVREYFQGLLADLPVMISVKQYRSVTGICHTTASKHVKEGIIDSCRIGGRRLIFRDSVKHVLVTRTNIQNASNDNSIEGVA